MKKFNYFYDGRVITKNTFEVNVPENWQEEIDEYGCYSWGLYTASEIDTEE